MHLLVAALWSASIRGRFDPVLPQVSNLKEVASQLAVEMGATIEVEPQIARLKVAYLRHNEEPKQLLNAIAFCASATLQINGQRLILARTDSDKVAIRNEDRALVRGLMSKALAGWDNAIDQAAKPEELAKRVAKTFHDFLDWKTQAFTPGASQRMLPKAPQVGPVLPVGRLLRGIIDRIGLGRLADIDPETSCFYSNSPDADEIAMPKIDDLITMYGADRETFRIQSSTLIDWDRWRREGLPAFEGSRATPPPSSIKVVLHVHRDQMWIQCKLLCFDSAGNLLDAVSFASVPLGPLTPYALEASRFFHRSQSRWENLTDHSGIFTAHFPDIGAETPMIAQFSKWPTVVDFGRESELFTRPDKYEPDLQVVPEALWGMQDPVRPMPLVCVVPDEAWTQALACVQKGRVNLDAFTRLSLTGGVWGPQLERSDVGGVIALRPVDPLTAELYQADRLLIAKLIRNTVQEGRVRLRTWSVFQHDMGLAGGAELTRRYLMDLRIAEPRLMGSASPIFFRFLGGIPEAAWQDLVAGHSATVESAEQALALHNSIVQGDWKLKSEKPLSQLEAQPQEIYRETEAPSVAIHLKLSSETIAVWWAGEKAPSASAGGETASQIGASMGSLVLAEQRMRKLTHKEDEPDEQVLIDLFNRTQFKFRAAPRLNYAFIIGDPAGLRLEKSLSEDGDLANDVLSFPEMPKEFRNELVGAALKRAAALRQTSVPDDRQPPPPEF